VDYRVLAAARIQFGFCFVQLPGAHVRIVRITNDGAQTKDNEGKQKYFGDHFFLLIG
jgi:hypothetical protein